MSKKSKRNNQKRMPQQKRKNKNRPRRQPVVGHNSLGLSACAAHYALAVGSPYSREANGACVPTFPARMSQKVTAFQTGAVIVGGQQFGFVGVAPCVANNGGMIYSSTGAYNGTSVDYLNGTGVFVASLNSLPYSSAQLLGGDVSVPAPVSGRIVSCAIRVRYVGTELNKGGIMYCLVTPDHTNTNGLSMQTLSAYSETIKMPVGRQWTTIVASAIDQSECSYPEESSVPTGDPTIRQMLYPFSQQNAISPTAQTVGAPIIIIGIQSTAQNSFEYEVVQHVEYIGPLTQSMATKSHSDQNGLSKVTEAAGNVMGLRAANGAAQEPSFLASLKKTIIDNQDVVVPLTRMAAQMYLGGRSTPRRNNLRAIQNGYGF
jgi:hypothetical protein